MINMSLIYSFNLFIITELKSSNSPMTLLVLLLFLMWGMSLHMMFMGKDMWSLIYLIMLFMGGLMITYLFIISMMPKEKKVSINIPFMKMTFLLMVLSMSWVNMDFSMNEMLNTSSWILVMSVALITVFVFIIFLLMMDPFKTMKSSF